jgi:hypothetical protein
MKKNILLTIAVLSMFLALPFNVSAKAKADSLEDTINEEINTFDGQEGYEDYVKTLKEADLSEYKESDDKVNVYIFRGSTCSHCLDAVAHFASIAKDEGKYFNVKTYEVWSNSDNNDLMNDAANEIGDSEVSGVPYIVIGKKSWSGYAASYDDEMMKEIKSEYNKDKSKRYDVIKAVNGEATGEKSSIAGDVISVVIIIAVIGLITFGIISARKKTN